MTLIPEADKCRTVSSPMPALPASESTWLVHADLSLQHKLVWRGVFSQLLASCNNSNFANCVDRSRGLKSLRLLEECASDEPHKVPQRYQYMGESVLDSFKY